ncbi:unnamed protein product, partial [Phaeothamnion confervicola]
ELSEWLSHDAAAADVAVALQALPSVDDVAVTRSWGGAADQFSWSVTFLKARESTIYGYIDTPMGNLPALAADGRRLRGTGATVTVSKVGGGAEDYAPWEGKRIGKFGAEAGAAYVYYRGAEAVGGGGADAWWAQQVLTGSDTDAGDRFGQSVSADAEYELIAVGAPYAEDIGVKEQQSVSCNAANGTFTLSFRGFETPPIPANVSLAGLHTLLRGPFGGTAHLHTLPELEVRDAYAPGNGTIVTGTGGEVFFSGGDGGLCTGNNTAVLTFRSPVHSYTFGNGDLEALTADGSGLGPAAMSDGDGFSSGTSTVTVAERVRGTLNPDGPYSDGLQKGAAYLFRRTGPGAGSGGGGKGSVSGAGWYQEAKLQLDDGAGTDRFGWQVLVQGRSRGGDLAAVAAPGRNDEKGAVYVYRFSSRSGGWVYRQALSSDLWSTSRDQFGTAMSLDGDTLVAGGAGAGGGAGAAYVFTLSRTGLFQGDQQLVLEDARAGDACGYSLQLYGNLIAVGCPGRDGAWRHTRRLAGDGGADVGAVYVYRRASSEQLFELLQRLTPTNVRPGSRFGAAVALHGGTLVASSLEAYQDSTVGYQRSVQTVTLSSSSSVQRLGGAFRLGWKTKCDAAESVCETRWTEAIEAAAAAPVVKTALAAAFGLGVGGSEVLVSRSGIDPADGGCRYTVTFLGESSRAVPAMTADAAALTPTAAAAVVVAVTNPVANEVRGTAHVFRQAESDDDGGYGDYGSAGGDDGAFVEQCFLYPWLQQQQDLLGFSAAVTDGYAAVGAPNRDVAQGAVSDGDLVDTNAGAVEVFALGFLDHRFNRRNYTVTEGTTLELTVTRATAGITYGQAFYVRSVDRNAEADLQAFVAGVYGLENSYPDVGVFEMATEVVIAGTATAQFRRYGASPLGVTASTWFSGEFDYRGLADYVPVNARVFMAAGAAVTTSVTLETANDPLLEVLDEDITVCIYVPGMFPSASGGLVATVVVLDDGDAHGPANATANWGTDNASPATYTAYDDARAYVGEFGAASGSGSSNGTRTGSEISPNTPRGADRFGAAIAVDEKALFMVVGDEFGSLNGSGGACGTAYVYRRNGAAAGWELEAVLSPPDAASQRAGAGFGQAVQIGCAYGRGVWTVLVGAPGAAAVYVYDRYDDGYGSTSSSSSGDDDGCVNGLGSWELVDVLTADGVTLADAGFGGARGLALWGDVAVVGAPGAEAAFVYLRTYGGSNSTSSTSSSSSGSGYRSNWTWARPPTRLRSADYEYDAILTGVYVHKQGYGAAVDVDAATRTLAVGSPYADYDKLGSDAVETWDTYPDHGAARARGKVFVYHFGAAAQTVTLGADAFMYAGEFRLRLTHHDVTANTTRLTFDASAAAVEAALEALSNVDDVEVSVAAWVNTSSGSGVRYAAGYYGDVNGGRYGSHWRRWTVMFASEYVEEPALLEALWNGNGCDDCAAISGTFENGGVNVDGNGVPRIAVARLAGLGGGWEQEAVLQASVKHSGDRFGHNLDLDGEEILVGAHHSSARAATTWDFETGDLTGWSATGTVFDAQPTYGDNPYFRNGYDRPWERTCKTGPPGRPQRSRLRGRYFVGTFERRPGAATAAAAGSSGSVGGGSYADPSPFHAPGEAQGDEPQGTLTSEAFTIGGAAYAGTAGTATAAAAAAAETTVSFLIGGGCDILTVYVELIVDGVSVARATGGCREEMRNATFDASPYAGRTARLRIVDAASGAWGHINVDEFRFGWAVRGGLHPSHAASGGAVATAGAGAVAGDAATTLALYMDAEATPRAGAVFVFARRPASSGTTAAALAAAGEFCPAAVDRAAACAWSEEAKLFASDMRPGDLFGEALALEHAKGLAAVGAPRARLLDQWRTPPRVLTTWDPLGNVYDTDGAPVQLPLAAAESSAAGVGGAAAAAAWRLRLTGAYGATGGGVSAQDGNGGPAVWQAATTAAAASGWQLRDADAAAEGTTGTGAVYLFARSAEARDAAGTLLPGAASRWPSTELARLQPSDARPADRFGTAVVLRAAATRALFAGAPHADTFGVGLGSVCYVDVGLARARFKRREYVVVEGAWGQLHARPTDRDDWKVSISLVRDVAVADDVLTVTFATSDLTARGVDAASYRACWALPPAARRPDACGDYEQTAGQLTFARGQTEASFFVRIMDDLCLERRPAYVQLTLGVVGGNAWLGEQFTAKLRIDDDDWDRPECE